MRKVIIKIAHPFIRAFAKYYFNKPRGYQYRGMKAVVNPGVFHPQFTISTKILLDYVDQQKLKEKRLLELGCGTGLVAVYAATKGAKVTATDVNVLALANTRLNAANNGMRIETINSNLFRNIDEEIYDYIIINPPYYPKKPKNDVEKAWYCGENFEYFQNLFETIDPYFGESSKVIMILSEDCNIDQIKQIALASKIEFRLLEEKKKWWEKNYLFQLKSVQIGKVEPETIKS